MLPRQSGLPSYGPATMVQAPSFYSVVINPMPSQAHSQHCTSQGPFPHLANSPLGELVSRAHQRVLAADKVEEGDEWSLFSLYLKLERLVHLLKSCHEHTFLNERNECFFLTVKKLGEKVRKPYLRWLSGTSLTLGLLSLELFLSKMENKPDRKKSARGRKKPKKVVRAQGGEPRSRVAVAPLPTIGRVAPCKERDQKDEQSHDDCSVPSQGGEEFREAVPLLPTTIGAVPCAELCQDDPESVSTDRFEKRAPVLPFTQPTESKKENSNFLPEGSVEVDYQMAKPFMSFSISVNFQKQVECPQYTSEIQANPLAYTDLDDSHHDQWRTMMQTLELSVLARRRGLQVGMTGGQ